MRYRIGFFPRGQCWKFNLEKQDYYTCTYWTFWRFYLCREKTLDEMGISQEELRLHKLSDNDTYNKDR